MYDLFVESSLNQNSANPAYAEPVKKHLYETILNTEFNLRFHVPAKNKHVINHKIRPKNSSQAAR